MQLLTAQRRIGGLAQLRSPARMQPRDVERAMLFTRARSEVRPLGHPVEHRLRRCAPMLALILARGLGHPRGDCFAARAELLHQLLADALDLKPVAVRAADPLQAPPVRHRRLQHSQQNLGRGTYVLAVPVRIRRPPLAVMHGQGRMQDLVVQVQLRVAVAAGVLVPAGHAQIRLAPLARLPAIHPADVRPETRVPGLCLEERERCLVGRIDHLIQRGDLPGPERLRLAVAVLVRPAGVLP
jgi:hypothetical protein